MAILALLAGLMASALAQTRRDVPPTATEQVIMQALLERLQIAHDKAPVPVTDAIRSMKEGVEKTFTAPAGSRYARVTIRIRTQHVHWRKDGEAEVWTRSANGTVGWYSWRWESRGEQTPEGRHLIVTANNTLMLDPVYTARNEKDTLGRLTNEVLLYHELLHGQLMMNAMDDPAWRAELVRTGSMEVSSRDAGHAVIHRLERDFLEHRAGNAAIVVEPVTGAGGKFRIVAGQLPKGFRGGVSVDYQLVGEGNVRNLRLSLPERGLNAGSVLIEGDLIDPSRPGFFLAVLEQKSRA